MKTSAASLPTRECGLKHPVLKVSTILDSVTPHAGVWIETVVAGLANDENWSLPTRECGLKRICAKRGRVQISSLPTRECGLKQRLHRSRVIADIVTPHAGVWIETTEPKNAKTTYGVTPHAGVWIETPERWPLVRSIDVTPHAGVWIETQPLSRWQT